MAGYEYTEINSLHTGKHLTKKLMEDNVTYNTIKIVKYLEINLRDM